MLPYALEATEGAGRRPRDLKKRCISYYSTNELQEYQLYNNYMNYALLYMKLYVFGVGESEIGLKSNKKGIFIEKYV